MLVARFAFHSLKGPWALPGDPSRLRIFLLMGQSNMAGFGCVRDDDPWQPGDREAVPGVLVLGGQCTLKSGIPRGWSRWRPAAHPLHLNQRSAGFGLALPFAQRLRESEPDAMIGLIPCAWGGAGIDRLGPGSPLFANAVRRARIAAKSGTLAGVLWHQGETDAGSPELARSHANKLLALITSLQNQHLNAYGLPFLIGDLGDFEDEKRKPEFVARRNTVRAGLRRIGENYPGAAFVESKGLPGVDAVHFGREALVEFGRRYAEAYLAMPSAQVRRAP